MGRVVAQSDSPELNRVQIDPFTAGSSFRELDDVFLQTQTRIWLGEVLQTRLEEETSIADLLADGKLLSNVSKVIWKMLLTKFMKLRSSMAYFSKSVSRNNSGRYMPYSNVDSFLKICQILGLSSIDLFSPSDVVEKRDIRRVCMCIRSLSKKAISKDLNVPDFDVVTYTVAMPTDMVKGIRKSLEQSHCRFSEDSAGCSTPIFSRPKYVQKNWGAVFARQYDSCSEESDTADSDYQEFGYNSPASTTSCSGVSLLNSDMLSSPQGSPVTVDNFYLTQYMSQTDVRNDEIDENNNSSYSPSPEAKGSPNAYHLLNNNHHFTDHLMDLNSGTLHRNKGAVRRAIDTPEDETLRVSLVNHDPESSDSFVLNSVNQDQSERNVLGHLSTSDINYYGTDSDVVIDTKIDFFVSDSVSMSSTYQHGREFFEEIEDADVTSTAFSDLGKAYSKDCQDKYGGKDDLSNPNMLLPEHQKRIEYHIPTVRSTLDADKLQFQINLQDSHSANLLLKKASQLTTISNGKNSDATGFLIPHSVPVSYICESPIGAFGDSRGIDYTCAFVDDLKVSGSNTDRLTEVVRDNMSNLLLSGDCSSITIDSAREVLNGTTTLLATEEEKCSDGDKYASSTVSADDCVHRIASTVLDPCIQGSQNHLCRTPTSSENVKRDQHVLDGNELNSAHGARENHEKVACSTENLEKEKIKHEQVGRDVGASDPNGHRRRLLKSFAGGISVFGVFLLWFHLRRPNGRNYNEISAPSTQSRKTNKGHIIGEDRQQSGWSDRVYPAGNLRL